MAYYWERRVLAQESIWTGEYMNGKVWDRRVLVLESISVGEY